MKLPLFSFFCLFLCACAQEEYFDQHTVCFDGGSCVSEQSSGWRRGTGNTVAGAIGVTGNKVQGGVSFGNNPPPPVHHHHAPVYVAPSYQGTTYQNGNTTISRGTYYPGGYYRR
ncbi:MAG: hypothetical protein J6M05_06160 [Cardiobacteriaceae bacterium]|nr:hypothetical protein [Cardiobacteriaceae bacterium]